MPYTYESPLSAAANAAGAYLAGAEQKRQYTAEQERQRRVDAYQQALAQAQTEEAQQNLATGKLTATKTGQEITEGTRTANQEQIADSWRKSPQNRLPQNWNKMTPDQQAATATALAAQSLQHFDKEGADEWGNIAKDIRSNAWTFQGQIPKAQSDVGLNKAKSQYYKDVIGVDYAKIKSAVDIASSNRDARIQSANIAANAAIQRANITGQDAIDARYLTAYYALQGKSAQIAAQEAIANTQAWSRYESSQTAALNQAQGSAAPPIPYPSSPGTTINFSFPQLPFTPGTGQANPNFKMPSAPQGPHSKTSSLPDNLKPVLQAYLQRIKQDRSFNWGNDIQSSSKLSPAEKNAIGKAILAAYGQ